MWLMLLAECGVRNANENYWLFVFELLAIALC